MPTKDVRAMSVKDRKDRKKEKELRKEAPNPAPRREPIDKAMLRFFRYSVVLCATLVWVMIIWSYIHEHVFPASDDDKLGKDLQKVFTVTTPKPKDKYDPYKLGNAHEEWPGACHQEFADGTDYWGEWFWGERHGLGIMFAPVRREKEAKKQYPKRDDFKGDRAWRYHGEMKEGQRWGFGTRFGRIDTQTAASGGLRRISQGPCLPLPWHAP